KWSAQVTASDSNWETARRLPDGYAGHKSHYERRNPCRAFQAWTTGGSGIGACWPSDGEQAAMVGELILRNLLHRPLRTLIGAMGIAVEVALVVLIVGLTSGLLTETAKRIEGIGADIMLLPANSSVFFAFGSAPMPVKIGEKLAEMKYVQSVAPVLFQFNTSGVEIVYGIDPESFRAVSGGFVFIQGHDLEGPDDILVDDIAAKTKNLQPGQTYRIFNHDWHVAGIVEHGKGSRLFVSRATLQELVGARDKASVFFVKCTRPEHTEDVMEEIR